MISSSGLYFARSSRTPRWFYRELAGYKCAGICSHDCHPPTRLSTSSWGFCNESNLMGCWFSIFSWRFAPSIFSTPARLLSSMCDEEGILTGVCSMLLVVLVALGSQWKRVKAQWKLPSSLCLRIAWWGQICPNILPSRSRRRWWT